MRIKLTNIIFNSITIEMLFFSFPNEAAEVHESNLSNQFIQDFQTELANRDFSRLSPAYMKVEYKEQYMYGFWQSYYKLEHLNLKIYTEICEKWSLDHHVISTPLIKWSTHSF